MAYEQRELSGSLFKNSRKETDTHPDYTGRALVGGVEYFLDAWINTAKDGSKYMSLKMKPKEARGLPATNPVAGYAPANTTAMIDLDDDVPF